MSRTGTHGHGAALAMVHGTAREEPLAVIGPKASLIAGTRMFAAGSSIGTRVDEPAATRPRSARSVTGFVGGSGHCVQAEPHILAFGRLSH